MTNKRMICDNCKYYSPKVGTCEMRNTHQNATDTCPMCAVEDNIDWEQRRYEIAKEMMPVLYQDNELSEKGMAKEAILCANYLIQELKKVKDNDR